MNLVNGDVVFLRNGAPAVVKNVDQSSGKVVLDDDLAKVQQQSEKGLKNHLDEKQRASYNVHLQSVEGDSKQEEIRNLYETILFLKDSRQVDPKVLRYLENELMHRMHRDDYTPPNYQVDMRNLPQY